MVALPSSLPEGQSRQAETGKGKDVWVPLERYQAAMSDKRFPQQSTCLPIASWELPVETAANGAGIGICVSWTQASSHSIHPSEASLHRVLM